MFLQVSLLTAAFFQIANSASLRNDKIGPIDLNFNCISIQGEDEKHKSPILLIHGLTSSYASWDGVQQVLALRTGRRKTSCPTLSVLLNVTELNYLQACAVDLRNHGDSPWNNRTDIEAMAVDVGHFLDKQNIKKVNLIGHSLGGKTSIHYALKNPERVDSLIVEDMRPNSINHQAKVLVQTLSKHLLGAVESVPEGSTEEEARNILIDYFNKKLAEFGMNPQDDIAAKSLKLRFIDGKWQLNTYPYLLQRVVDDFDSLLNESKGLYEGPTLFIYGKLSPFKINEDKENILKLFPNAQLFGVEGAGHSIHGIHREFEDEVIKFLNK